MYRGEGLLISKRISRFFGWIFVLCWVLIWWITYKKDASMDPNIPNRNTNDSISASSRGHHPISTITSQTGAMAMKGNSISCSGLHNLSCEEPYFSRMQHIKHLCRSRKKRHQWKLNALKYIDKLKIVMCEVPKAASTVWHVLLLHLEGKLPNLTAEAFLKKRNGTSHIIKSFLTIPRTQARRKLVYYTSFMISRHPFERLVSAYLDKFTNRTNLFYYRKNVGRPIAAKQSSHYLHGVYPGTYNQPNKEEDVKTLDSFQILNPSQQKDVLKYIKVMNSGEISFYQFVKYLTYMYKRGGISNIDVHWMPQYLLCQPCSVQYSYVMRFEEVMKDSARLLKYIQAQNLHSANETIVFPKKERTGVDETITQKLFKDLPESDLQILRKMYSEDFLLFGYDPYQYYGQ